MRSASIMRLPTRSDGYFSLQDSLKEGKLIDITSRNDKERFQLVCLRDENNRQGLCARAVQGHSMKEVHASGE